MDDSRVLPFTARIGSGDGQEPAADDELVEAGNAYAAVRGVKAPPTLKFLRTDGRLWFAMSYAYLPIIWAESSGLLLLEYPGFHTVILAGNNLAPLEARLCDYRVTWIRQCSPSEAAGLPVAVTRIERLHRFPSREPDGSGSDN